MQGRCFGITNIDDDPDEMDACGEILAQRESLRFEVNMLYINWLVLCCNSLINGFSYNNCARISNLCQRQSLFNYQSSCRSFGIVFFVFFPLFVIKLVIDSMPFFS